MTRRWHFPLILVLATLGAATPAMWLTADDTRASAWDPLRRQDPEAAKEVGPAERRLLQRLSVAQARAFVIGIDPNAIELGDGTTLAGALAVRLDDLDAADPDTADDDVGGHEPTGRRRG